MERLKIVCKTLVLSHWRFALLFTMLMAAAGAVLAQNQPFEQESVKPVTLPDEAQNLRQISLDAQGQLWLLTNDSLWARSNDRWRRVDTRLNIKIYPNTRMFIHPQRRGMRLFAYNQGVYISSPGLRPRFIEHDFGVISDLTVGKSGDIWIGSEHGLFSIPRASGEVEPIDAIQEPVTAVAAHEREGLAVGSAQRLYHFDGRQWRQTYTHAVIDAAVTALAFDPAGHLWAGNQDALHRRTPGAVFERVGGQKGLPYNRISTLHQAADGALWLGTEHGAIRHYGGKWQYFAGPRWLSGETVRSIASYGDSVYVLTDNGVDQIRFEQWTLRDKAEHYAQQVDPRHDRYGLVADVQLDDYARPSEYTQRDDDNDGLWTAIYLASLCFRYAVTGEEAVKARAWHHFEAMERLERVTGRPGFIARSYVKPGEAHSSDGEWHESANGEWVWKGDTSSDELVGHMFVYPIMYDLVAETDDEKQRIRELVSRIMSHVVDNGFYLIDLDGQPTRWGVWAPEKLNRDPEWRLERGLNSLQILSFLVAAHHITENDKFMRAYDRLVNEHGYLQNLINQKITKPVEVNHSDDELAFLPYYTLIQYAKDEPLLEALKMSLERSWRIERPEKSALWNFIYGTFNQESFDKQEAVWTLQEWPISLVEWPVQNSHRLDVQISRHLSRFGRKQSIEVLPPDERPLGRWNANPYRLDSDGSLSIHDPGAWLLPYWMGRFHGFIE